jgi:hypothetical protein
MSLLRRCDCLAALLPIMKCAVQNALSRGPTKRLIPCQSRSTHVQLLLTLLLPVAVAGPWTHHGAASFAMPSAGTARLRHDTTPVDYAIKRRPLDLLFGAGLGRQALLRLSFG